MPIDPGIALSVRPPQIDNPIEKMLTLRSLAQQAQGQQQEQELHAQQIESNKLKLAAQQREESEVMATASALKQATGDYEKAAQLLDQGGFSAGAAELRKTVLATESSRFTLHEHHEKLVASAKEHLGELAMSLKRELKGGASQGTILAHLAVAAGDGLVDEDNAMRLWSQLRSTAPAQIDAFLDQYITPAQQEKQVELSKKTADAEKAELEAKALRESGGEKPPTNIDDAILQAYRKGDLKEQQRLLGLKAQVGAAGREPKAPIEPIDIAASTYTTVSGKKYVDLGEWQTPTDRSKAQKAAINAGVMPVNKDVADGLRAADTARTNFQAIWSQLEPYLPKDATGRLLGGPKNTLEKIFQTNPVLGAYGSWRTAAIQAVQALAEKGMGLRLNRAEIDLMLQNDIPQMTDDLPTAKQRIDNMMTLLDNKEKNALTRDRSVPATDSTPTVIGQKVGRFEIIGVK